VSRENEPGRTEEAVLSSAKSFVSASDTTALRDTAGTLIDIDFFFPRLRSLAKASLRLLSWEDEVPALPAFDSCDNRPVSARPLLLLLLRLSAAVAALRRLLSPVLLLVYESGRSFDRLRSSVAGRLRGIGVLSSRCRSLGLSAVRISLDTVLELERSASEAGVLEEGLTSLVRLDRERLNAAMNLKAVGGGVGWEEVAW
jgi:hypothetical protein